VRYLQSLTPERVIRIRGIDYAWVYRTPETVPDELIPAARIVRHLFGSSILLLGHDMPNLPTVATGQPPTVTVALYWQCLAPMNEDYDVDVRLIDAGGKAWAEERSQPYGDQYATSKWPRGAILRDSHELDLPADLPPGDYRLAVGLVSDTTGARLAPATDDVIIEPVHFGGGQSFR
jgi:hypothetical protein